MIVQCNTCGAKFRLDDSKIPDKGAKVRCSKCKAVFTVKKPKPGETPQPKEEAKPAAPPPSPPPSEPSPPEAPAADSVEEDPFSDFNFSDDFDLGSKEEAPPSGSEEKGVDAEVAASGGEDFGGDFDFGGDDFSLADEPAAGSKPGPPPPEDFASFDMEETPSPPPAPSSGASPGGEDDFGDFKFDEESFAEPPDKTEPPPAPAVDEWGNVNLTGDEPAPEPGPGDDFDEAGFGDFKFDQDDTLPSSSEDEMELAADEFVRSPSAKAPVRDSLEASLEDSEPEVSREAVREAPPPPPKPVAAREAPTGRGKGIGIVVALVLAPLVLLMGVVGYTNKMGWFTFSDLFGLKFDKIGPAYEQFQYHMGWKEPPDTGEPEVVEDSVKPVQVVRDDGTVAIALTGEIINKSRKPKLAIKVAVDLKLVRSSGEEEVISGESYCDVYFTKEELKTMSPMSIRDIMSISQGRDQGCLEVKPGETRKFAVVFFPDISDVTQVKFSKPRVVDYKNLGEVEEESP